MKPSQVYCNRTLNLKKINYIGLDMDHTLIRYHTENFEALAYKVMLEKLIADCGYPESIRSLKFEFDRAIRGLVMDKAQGNVLKLSRHAAIKVSYHGLSAIDFRKQKKLYKSTYIDLSDPKYDAVDTSFSIAFATLFMQLVELKETSENHTLPEFIQIAEDLNGALDRGHRDGSIKDRVKEDLDSFIVKDPESVAGLEKFKKHNKKLFILTNSDFYYTKLLLDHAINPFLKEHDSWLDLFDITITAAQKPRFFFDRLGFLKVDPTNGKMTNHDGPITPGVYQGGCASTFTDSLRLEPNEILYIGDHIYGDIVRLKKDCAWRTALVVEELETEVGKAAGAVQVNENIQKLMEQKMPLENQLDELMSNCIENSLSTRNEANDELIQKITEIDQKIAPLIKEHEKYYNTYWGETMRAGNEESYFAYQVERFACIYMSRLSDLLRLSPRTYFRAFRRPQPHEHSAD